MDHHESIINVLAVMARKNLNEAMILEACLEFTLGELHNASADMHFKERFGERLHWIMRNIIEHEK